MGLNVLYDPRWDPKTENKKLRCYKGCWWGNWWKLDTLCRLDNSVVST